MKRLLLLSAVLLVGQNSFSGNSNPYQRPSLERSCYDLWQIMKRIAARNKDQRQESQLEEDLAKLENFELSPSEFLKKYEDMIQDHGFFGLIVKDIKAFRECITLDWFREGVEKLKK